MSTRKSGFTRYSSDHFEPQEDMDLTAQRRLRGQLEHIDYTVFASNREVIHTALGSADSEKPWPGPSGSRKPWTWPKILPDSRPAR